MPLVLVYHGFLQPSVYLTEQPLSHPLLALLFFTDGFSLFSRFRFFLSINIMCSCYSLATSSKKFPLVFQSLLFEPLLLLFSCSLGVVDTVSRSAGLLQRLSDWNSMGLTMCSNSNSDCIFVWLIWQQSTSVIDNFLFLRVQQCHGHC